MWRKWNPPSRARLEQSLKVLRQQKKAKFYADEDIEEGVVDVLRECGVNITSARELGHRGKPDSFHAALAFKQKRFLLTRNGRHYLNDRKFPLHPTHGIVVIAADPGDEGAYTSAIAQLANIVPYGELYSGHKLELSANEIKARCINDDGRMTVSRLKWDRGSLYEWDDCTE